MPYVKPEDRDTVWYIWNELYRVRIPAHQTRSKDHIRHFGTFVTGIKEIDKELKTEQCETMITIDRMIEYFRNGIVVAVVNHADCKKIYDRITDHLLMWRNQLERKLNNGAAPIDDFILMDNFADAVFPHARKFMGTESEFSTFFRQMHSIMPVSREKLLLAPPNSKSVVINPLSEEEKEEAKKKEEEENKPKRNEMASFFTSYTRAASGQRWG